MSRLQPDADSERALAALAGPIVDAARAQRAAQPLTERWLQLLMQRLERSESFRVQALRFIDVFPALRDDAEVERHLNEYFAAQELPLPAVARWGLSSGFGGRHTRAVAVRMAVEALAQRFMGGENSTEARSTISSLREAGLDFTLDALGEASVSEVEADVYQARYLALIRELSAAIDGWADGALLDSAPDRRFGPRLDQTPRLNLSLKVSALYSQLDAVDTEGSITAVCARLRPIVAAARKAGAALCLDMEQYEFKGVVLGVLRQLLMEDEFRDWPQFAVAIQAYLKDAMGDLEDLLAWARERGTAVSVRLVRGAYWDYETVIAAQRGWPLPVWKSKAETDRQFDRCADWLIAHRDWLRPLIATHNLRSVVTAMAAADRQGMAPHDLEFQVLHGMGAQLAAGIRAAGYPVRVYVPFGALIPGMAYLVRRLLENSASQQWGGFQVDFDRPIGELLQVAPVGPAMDLQAPGFHNEAPRQFHVAAVRQRFVDALDRVEAELGHHYPLIIDAKRVATADEMVSLDPAGSAAPAGGERVVGRVAIAGRAEAERALDAATAALADWSARPMRERAGLMRGWADALRQRRDEFAAWELFEAGKGWREADADVAEAIDFLEFYAAQAEVLGAGERCALSGEDNHTHYRARGVAVVIPPWNFPLAITVGMTAAALVTGNTVVLKPSSRTPVVAARFVDLLRAEGLPPGVLQFLPGRGADVGEYLVAHPRVHVVAFTGSLAVGTRIAELAARRGAAQRHVKAVLLEMGGRNAIIVDADADLDEAVVGVLRSAFGFQGQKCSACSRVVLVGSVAEPFLRRLVAAARSLRIGPPRDPGNAFGPLIDAEAARRVRAYIDAARATGRVVFEASLDGLGENYIAPVIIDGIGRDHELARKEVFGPALSVFHAADFATALAIANDADYALTGGVFSRSPAHLALARREFQVGNLYLNRGITGALVGRQPFGGFRLSGNGDKAGGGDYLKRFLLPLTVTENTLRRGFAPLGAGDEAPP